MGIKKMFTLLLCALLIVTTFGSSMAFAEKGNPDEGANGTGGQQVIIHEAGKAFKNKQEMWLHFDSGDVRAIVQGSTITALIGHNNGINKGTEVEFTLIPSKDNPIVITGVITIIPHEGNDAGEDNIFHFDKGTNNYDGIVTFNPPAGTETDKGNLIIEKQSNLQEEKTFVFDIKKNGEIIRTVEVNASAENSGTVEVEGLEVGEYTIVERDANEEGYTLEVTGDKTVVITKDATSTATIVNTYTEDKESGKDPEPKKGEVAFDKVVSGKDHNDGLPASFTFKLTKVGDASIVYTATVDFDNAGTETVRFAGIPIGEYYLTEVEDENWSSDIAGKEIIVKVEDDGKDGVNVTINGKNDNAFKVTNTYIPKEETEAKGFLLIRKTTDKNGSFEFVIRDSKGNKVAHRKINLEKALNGEAEIVELPVGDYTIEEVNAGEPGFTLSTSVRVGETADMKPGNKLDNVAIDEGKTTIVEFKNEYTPIEEIPGPKPQPGEGNFVINKVIDITGTVTPEFGEGLTFLFTLTNKETKETWNQLITFTSDNYLLNQTVKFDELEPGSYVLTETLADGSALPSGWKSSVGEGLDVNVAFDGTTTIESGLLNDYRGDSFTVTNTYHVIPWTPIGPSEKPDPEIPWTPIGPSEKPDPTPDPTPTPDPEPIVPPVDPGEPEGPEQPTPPDENLPIDPEEPVEPENPLPPDENLPLDPEEPTDPADPQPLPDDEGLIEEPEAPVNPDLPQTGDAQNLVGWMSLMLTALAALGVTIAMKKEEN